MVDESSSPIDFSFDEAANRFEAHVPGSDEVAFIQVAVGSDLWNFLHTEVPQSFQGRGIGSGLVKAALQHVREIGAKIRPLCPFVVSYLKDHPEEADVVHPRFRRILD